jgi:hypothetical protein
VVSYTNCRYSAVLTALAVVMASISACGPDKEPLKPLMAKCRVGLHSDRRLSELGRFEICMEAKSYHLQSTIQCRARTATEPFGGPTPYALNESDCWVWDPDRGNWP